MSRARLIVSSTDHQDDVMQLAFSEQRQGTFYLASASKDGRALLRNGASGQCVASFQLNSIPMLSVDISACANRLVVGSEDGCASIWNTKSGELVTHFEETSPVNCVAFGKSSPYLAVACVDRHSLHKDDDVVCVYPLEHGKKPEYYGGHLRGVRDVIFCRDDRGLLTSSHDRTIRFFDRVDRDREVHSIVLPHHAKSLELNADGRTVTIAYGQSVIFLDVDRFKVLQHRRFAQHITGASLHPRKKYFICSSSNCVYKFDYHSGELLEHFVAHDQAVRSIKYSPDIDTFATSSIAGEVRVWKPMSDSKYAQWQAQQKAAKEQSEQSESESSSSDSSSSTSSSSTSSSSSSSDSSSSTSSSSSSSDSSSSNNL